MDRTQNCAECEFMKTYDYGNRIYYCDHADRTDDMGKLSVDGLPEGNSEWCPLKGKTDKEIMKEPIKDILYPLDELQKLMYENMPDDLKREYSNFVENK